MFGCWVNTPQCIPRLFSSLLSRNTGDQGRVDNSTGEFGYCVYARLSAITQLRHNDEHIYHSDTTPYRRNDYIVSAASEEELDQAEEERVTAHGIILQSEAANSLCSSVR